MIAACSTDAEEQSARRACAAVRASDVALAEGLQADDHPAAQTELRLRIGDAIGLTTKADDAELLDGARIVMKELAANPNVDPFEFLLTSAGWELLQGRCESLFEGLY